MPRQSTILEVRLSNISRCVAITANTLNVLVDILKTSGLEAISNTVQSLLKLVEAIKQNKSDCTELMEHSHKLLGAIIGVYVDSDTGVELPPSTLNEIANFTQTLHKIHTLFDGKALFNRGSSKGSLGLGLDNCYTPAPKGFFKIEYKALTSKSVACAKMPRQPTITKVRLNNISTCVAITASTLNFVVETLKISGLEAIPNTTQSLLNLLKTVKQEKNECAELMEQTHKLLSAIIGLYVKSDTGTELAPPMLNEIANFTQ
ncbi:hypothetical protein C8F04DRAFT_1180307 [Mycena alexandri]|uniref:Uncharacterized protein n=1 Tax=Mycena alexandri TaxID=1745969 RepID=A0AAD6X7A4_9AGAR|nr:hypothetical protein C8F04DRAFT_1180307 [Mycena alexandri]